MLSLKSRYLRLAEKAQGKALDHSKGMIFTFLKYCRCCGKGLVKPNPWDRRTARRLFRLSFCTDPCLEHGERPQATFPAKVKPEKSSYRNEYALEEMAFVALEMKRELEAMSPMKQLVHRARESFRLLSEQLSFLEMETGENWYPAKLYYWVGKRK